MRCVVYGCAFLLAAFYLGGTTAAALSGSAPADAAFGPFKMTPLQIRLKISNLGRAYHARWTSDHDILHDGLLAESALRSWRTAYPGDPWLPQTAFHLEQLYQQLQDAQARKHATALLAYIVQYWPNTSYGRVSRKRLAQGFPHLHAEPAVRPTPNPYARRTTPAPRRTPLPRRAPSTPSPLPVRPSPTMPAPTSPGAPPT